RPWTSPSASSRASCAATRKRSRTIGAGPRPARLPTGHARKPMAPVTSEVPKEQAMRMSDFVVREAIIPALTASSKEGVIRAMVESLRAAGQFRGADTEDIIRAILKRELLGSTGIGRGVAIPHTKHNSAEKLVGTVALAPGGVAFESLDGEPVYIFVLL